MGFFKRLLDPISGLDDKVLIKHMFGRLSEEATTYSGVRRCLLERYRGLSKNDLAEEKNGLELRLLILKHVPLEAMSATGIIILIALLSVVTSFLIWSDQLGLFKLVLLSLLFFYWLYYKRLVTRAKEIAYCSFALGVLKQFCSEKLGDPPYKKTAAIMAGRPVHWRIFSR